MKLNNRYVLAAVTLLIAGIVIYTFREIVSYVLIAWVVSMVGAPLVKFLRKYLGKNIAAGLTLAVFALGMALLLWIFIPPLSTQARNLAGIDYNKLIRNLEEPIGDWESWLSERGLVSAAEQPTAVLEEQPQSATDHIRTQIVDMDSLLASQGGSRDSVPRQNITLLIQIDDRDSEATLRSSETAPQEHDSFFDRTKKNLYSFLDPSRIPKLFTSVVGTFIAFFFLKEQGLFNNMLASIIPDKYESQTVQAINETSRLLIRYFTGVLGQMTVITIFVSVVLSVLGVKNALLIGFFAALMNVIPYIGPIIGAGFALIITISSNLDVSFYDEMVPLISKVVITFVIMQVLDNFILQPNIFSKSVKAHPLEIFLVVLIGAQLGGVGGMVLAIPVYTVLRVIGKVFLSEFKVVQSITKGL